MRWRSVYHWRHDLPFTRPGSDDTAEAAFETRELPALAVPVVLDAARVRWRERQSGNAT